MTLRGIDYAFFPHPPVWALKVAGIKWVGRYVSGNDGKGISAPELAALNGGGLPVMLFAESYANRMLEGHAAGVADATAADKIVTSLGIAGIPLYFAADFDATPAQQVPIDAYLDGAASVIGHARTGLYGGYYVVKRALDAGKAAFSCQTLAWSGGQWDSRANIQQHLGIHIAGVSVDEDEAMTADFGQWPRPGSPPPPPPPPTIKMGSTGHWVRLAQTDLNRHGAKPPLIVDGIFGQHTHDATVVFQKTVHLVPDGIIGPLTWGELAK